MTVKGLGPGRVTRLLTADGGLRLVLDRTLLPLAKRWVPEEPGGWIPRLSSGALIDVRCSARPVPRSLSPATLSLGSVRAWLDRRRGVVRLRGALPSSGGEVSLASHRARLRLGSASGEQAAADLYSMLTTSAALLVAAAGGALVHAAAVVAPDDRAWLLVGDARSGKSTTCANLARAGWGFLSDDQSVLTAAAHVIMVEGWLRPFHLDEGWERGEVSGRRRALHPASLGLGSRQRLAPLAGILLPTVQAEQPTTLAPVSAGRGLALLIRQSPWLLVHRALAEPGIALLSAAARSATFSLTLGLDTYHDPERLRRCVAPLESANPTAIAGRAPPPVSRATVHGRPPEKPAVAQRGSARLAAAP